MITSTDLVVLILGEKDMGREPVFRHLYDKSRRSVKPLVVANCGLLSVQLALFVLFEYVKRTFTGADCATKIFSRDGRWHPVFGWGGQPRYGNPIDVAPWHTGGTPDLLHKQCEPKRTLLNVCSHLCPWAMRFVLHRLPSCWYNELNGESYIAMKHRFWVVDKRLRIWKGEFVSYILRPRFFFLLASWRSLRWKAVSA